MTIKFGNIAFSASKLAVPCSNGFTVTAIVNGIENGLGGTYDVKVYDEDGFANPDDLLAELKGVTVTAGTGRFRNIHSFDLTCSGDCEVEGSIKGKTTESGESCADLYAFVREPRANGNKTRSPGVEEVCCIEEDECTIVSDDATADADSRINLTGDGGDNRLVRFRFSTDEPVIQCFDDDVDADIQRVAIGDDKLAFAEPVVVTWRLSDDESNVFKELDGRVVRFDPSALKWSTIEYDYTGKTVKFPILGGGLFGIAAHARFTEVCYTAIDQLPEG